MKALGFLVCALMSVSALATVYTASGNGNASGFCDGSPSGYWCLDSIKQRARQDALNQADLNCHIHNGVTQPSYTASCYSEYCSPFSIPPNSPSQMVSCQSQCQIGCDVKETE
jgi:hypothetical protein